MSGEFKSLNLEEAKVELLLQHGRATLLEVALLALIHKLEIIAEDKNFLGAFRLLANHGMEYAGPNWELELEQAKAALNGTRAIQRQAEEEDEPGGR